MAGLVHGYVEVDGPEETHAHILAGRLVDMHHVAAALLTRIAKLEDDIARASGVVSYHYPAEGVSRERLGKE